MALKMDRQINATEIGYFLNEVAERGVFLTVSTGGSGVALDSTKNVATVSAVASGNAPLGVLLNDFVNVDQTRTYVNFLKDESVVGNKCTILKDGWIVTNKVLGTPAAGNLAILAESGNLRGIANVNANTNAAAFPVVGKFLSSKDQDGYARVQVGRIL